MRFASTKIAIVGGGASGTLLTVQLLRQARLPLTILLYDPAETLGKGVAYGTNDVAHLLNVPAGKMSAYPDQPDHFLAWLNAPANCASLVSGGKFEATHFVPRAIYARYLASVLDEAIIMGRKYGARFFHRREAVVDFIPTAHGGTIVSGLADTEEVGLVALALGNLPPRHPLARDHPFFRSRRYVPMVWRPGALARVKTEDPLLIVGSGLTALDTLAALHRRGHTGEIIMTSRNGRLPEPHAAVAPYRDFLAELPWPSDLRGWVRLFRREIARAAESGINWRSVFDSLRPHTQKIWQSLSRSDRLRFLRHVRPLWEGHRHRAPQTVRQIADDLIACRQLKFLPGRLRDFSEKKSQVVVTLQPKGSLNLASFQVSQVLNCIGPESNFRHRLNDPLIINLIARGVLHPDPLYLGLDATPDGIPLGEQKREFPQVVTIGPPLKGVLWETTAIPEIRVQAVQRAGYLLRRIDEAAAWQI